MHSLFGFTITEWGSIVGIITAIGAAIGLIIKMTSIMNQLENSITVLNSTLHDLVNDNHDIKQRLDRVEDRFEEHVGEAKVRNTRITNLEKEVFNDKRRR